MIDRYDFYERYGVRPTAIYSLNIGEAFVDEKKHLKLEVKDHTKNEDTGFYDTITFTDGKETLIVDLAPHWEKGPNEDLRFCRDGIMNLIRAVYAKAEEDYEALYLNGYEEIKIKRLPGENQKEFCSRRAGLYKEAVTECELFLGKLFIKYAKIKALWSLSHDPNVMAAKLNETPSHVVCIIDRLGLNRLDSPKEDDCDDRTVKLSTDFKGTF